MSGSNNASRKQNPRARAGGCGRSGEPTTGGCGRGGAGRMREGRWVTVTRRRGADGAAEGTGAVGRRARVSGGRERATEGASGRRRVAASAVAVGNSPGVGASYSSFESASAPWRVDFWRLGGSLPGSGEVRLG
uniref:Uncharacterized protein n=1 Tax=Leersia perrieri TaxID=77586 RepID=A0A0D9WX18_9ORYZ